MDARSWPIFIVGCRRSGASLLRYVLDAHEDIACPPESHFISGLFAFLQSPNTLDGLASMGMSKSDITRELGQLASSIMGGYAQRKGKKRWADKTPSYHRVLDFIDDIFGGQVQYLFMVRHPLDNIESLYANGAYSVVANMDPEVKAAIEAYGAGRYGYAKFWADTNERIYLFASSRESRSRIIRYEDLVARPEEVTSQICAFIGAEYTSSLLQRAFLEPHDVGPHDHAIASTTSIERGRTGKWTRWPEREIASLWLIVGTLAERLGYVKPDAGFPQSWAP
jgi:protein-tyrosine sulfotransferase